MGRGVVVVVAAPSSAQGFDPGDVVLGNASQVPTTYNSYEVTPSPPGASTPGPKFNPSMAIIVVVLVGAFIFVAFFSVYMRRCARGLEVHHGNNITSSRVAQRRVAAAAAAAAFASEDQLSLDLHRGQGIDKALVEAMPVVSYSVVKESLKEGRRGGSKESLDCAVCLNEFDQDEHLRLLPGCNHAFHLDCIDVWLQSHSTCPLCRSNLRPLFKELVEGGGGGGRGPAAAIGEISRRMLEAAEEAFGSAREGGRRIPASFTISFDGIPSQQTADDEDTTQGSGGGGGSGMGSSSQIGRVGSERHSARLALSRNSESFRQAALGVEVREELLVAAASSSSSARYPSLAPILVDKVPRRASSLKFPNLAGKDHLKDHLYDVESLFPYGSQRLGANGSAKVVAADMGTAAASSPASSLVELQTKAENSENMLGQGRRVEEEKHMLSELTSARDEDEWITIDIAFLDQQNSPAQTHHQSSRSMKFLPIEIMQAADVRNHGKSSLMNANVGGGAPHEVRAVGSDRWSFSSLRGLGSFSLSRSASDRRPQLPVPMQVEEDVHQAVVPPQTAAAFNPLEQTQQGGGAVAGFARESSSSRNGSIQSFARRTMQWFVGSERSSNNSAPPGQATPSQQQIITPQ
ncbi:unnamed protein product [Sphagnum troendelagicum]|jgi:hypothetical protein